MKSVKDVVLDDKPKTIAKIEKALRKKNVSAEVYEAFKREVENGTDFPKNAVIVTDSYICNYNLAAIGFGFTIVPLNSIDRIYRTNVWNNQYQFDYFNLKIETSDGATYLFAMTPRASAKTLDAYVEIIDEVKRRKALLEV